MVVCDQTALTLSWEFGLEEGVTSTFCSSFKGGQAFLQGAALPPVDDLQVAPGRTAVTVQMGPSLPALPRWPSRCVQTDVASLVPRRACMGLGLPVKGARQAIPTRVPLA